MDVRKECDTEGVALFVFYTLLGITFCVTEQALRR